MKCMEYGDVMYQSAASKSGPVKCMCMDQVKLAATSAQLQEKFEEEVGLCKETFVGTGPLRWFREVGGMHTVGYHYWLNTDTGYKRVVSSKQCDVVSALYQSLGEIGQQRLRSTQIRLGDGRDQ